MYLVGVMDWLTIMIDFSLWIVMQLLYCDSSLSCDDTLEGMTLATIIIRWFTFTAYLWVAIHHLCDKIRQENKRKFGRNPFKKKHTHGKKGWKSLWAQGLGDQTGEEQIEPDDSHASVALHMGAGGGGGGGGDTDFTSPRNEHARQGTSTSTGGHKGNFV